MERLYLTERLINADELIKHLDYVCTGSGLWSNILKDVIEDCKEFVNHELTVDAVPVVRCKDCIHWREYDKEMMCAAVSSDPYEAWASEANDYCSLGERKDGEKNENCV